MSDSKDTIYIDIDDEITSIIEKLSASKKKIVALVLPKRATVFQSIVNMRLLKRAADDSNKSVVLITSEASILPLAAAVGIHVAKTLQSKPAIPAAAGAAALATAAAVAANDVSEAEDVEVDPEAPVGELAGDSDDEAIEVDNEIAEVDPDATKVDDKKSKKSKKDKKFKIPNFDTFKKKMFLGAGIFVLLVIGWYFFFQVLPKATIIIKTDTVTTGVDLTFTTSPSAQEVDAENKVVPGKVQELKKENTQKVPTTGEKNLGEKATGEVTMSTSTNCLTALPTIPAGTTVSSSNLNFITQQAASFSSPPVVSGGKCVFKSNEVTVGAENAGGQYNLSSRTYGVSGYSGVTAEGTNMTGGTDKIVKIVAQADIDTAKAKALEQNTDGVKAELADNLKKDEYIPITDTFAAGNPAVVATPAVGAEATEVTAKVTTAYTMLGAQEAGVKTLVETEAKKQIDTSKQAITDDGLSNATYQIFDRKPDGETRMNVKTTVTAGTQLNVDEVKKQVAGKRRGEVQEILNQPSIKDIEIKFSPFYVTKVPTNPNKITIIFENAGD